jgi:hypothetical protein
MDYNELNILENGFSPEFKLAQANLQANIAAGKGNTFAYSGAAGTAPLPIFLAYLNGSKATTDPTKYSGSGWTNTTLVQSMYPLNPNPYTAGSNIWASSTNRAFGLAAGYPSNFWVANPDIANANVVTNGPKTSYNGVQLALKRRMASGLLFELNYTYGKGWQDTFYSFHKPYVTTEQTYSNSGAGNEAGNVRHVGVANWMYSLPFGRGQHFASGVNRFVDWIIGGWSLQGVARVQSGRMLDFGNIRMIGMTADELRNSYQIRKVTDPVNPHRTNVYMLPQDIIDNTIKAYSQNAGGYTAGAPTGRYFAPANSPTCMETVNGFGDCGLRSVIVTGPKVARFDFNLIKQIRLTERLSLEGQAQVFNVFNNVNFNPVTGLGTVQDNYQTTGAIDQSRTMQLAFRISF